MKNQIELFWHCKKCLEEYEKGRPQSISRNEFQKIEAGWTKQGFQVWCSRHDCNIQHFDLCGNKVEIIPDYGDEKTPPE